MKRLSRSVLIVLALVLGFAFGSVRLPYYAVGPGPAREVEPLIDIQDHQRYGSTGKLIMTTIRWFKVTPLQAVKAWIDPNQSVVSQDDIYPPGEDVEVEQQRSLSQMDESKIDATSVALSSVTAYPKDHGAGALIESIGADCPADGNLFPGDTILSIDGQPVGSAKDASRVIEAAPAGRPMAFQVQAADETHRIEVAKGACPGTDDPKVGVSLVNAFPFPVTIASGDIGGPSAGLMFALGVYDALTPEDLTEGRTIAGTGTIDTAGRVGRIGGIRDKVVAAERVGAQIFLVPRGDFAALAGVDTGEMRLIPVRSFDQAITALSSG